MTLNPHGECDTRVLCVAPILCLSVSDTTWKDEGRTVAEFTMARIDVCVCKKFEKDHDVVRSLSDFSASLLPSGLFQISSSTTPLSPQEIIDHIWGTWKVQSSRYVDLRAHMSATKAFPVTSGDFEKATSKIASTHPIISAIPRFCGLVRLPEQLKRLQAMAVNGSRVGGGLLPSGGHFLGGSSTTTRGASATGQTAEGVMETAQKLDQNICVALSKIGAVICGRGVGIGHFPVVVEPAKGSKETNSSTIPFSNPSATSAPPKPLFGRVVKPTKPEPTIERGSGKRKPRRAPTAAPSVDRSSHLGEIAIGTSALASLPTSIISGRVLTPKEVSHSAVEWRATSTVRRCSLTPEAAAGVVVALVVARGIVERAAVSVNAGAWGSWKATHPPLHSKVPSFIPPPHHDSLPLALARGSYRYISVGTADLPTAVASGMDVYPMRWCGVQRVVDYAFPSWVSEPSNKAKNVAATTRDSPSVGSYQRAVTSSFFPRSLEGVLPIYKGSKRETAELQEAGYGNMSSSSSPGTVPCVGGFQFVGATSPQHTHHTPTPTPSGAHDSNSFSLLPPRVLAEAAGFGNAGENGRMARTAGGLRIRSSSVNGEVVLGVKRPISSTSPNMAAINRRRTPRTAPLPALGGVSSPSPILNSSDMGGGPMEMAGKPGFMNMNFPTGNIPSFNSSSNLKTDPKTALLGAPGFCVMAPVGEIPSHIQELKQPANIRSAFPHPIIGQSASSGAQQLPVGVNGGTGALLQNGQTVAHGLHSGLIHQSMMAPGPGNGLPGSQISAGASMFGFGGSGAQNLQQRRALLGGHPQQQLNRQHQQPAPGFHSVILPGWGNPLDGSGSNNGGGGLPPFFGAQQQQQQQQVPLQTPNGYMQPHPQPNSQQERMFQNLMTSFFQKGGPGAVGSGGGATVSGSGGGHFSPPSRLPMQQPQPQHVPRMQPTHGTHWGSAPPYNGFRGGGGVASSHSSPVFSQGSPPEMTASVGSPVIGPNSPVMGSTTLGAGSIPPISMQAVNPADAVVPPFHHQSDSGFEFSGGDDFGHGGGFSSGFGLPSPPLGPMASPPASPADSFLGPTPTSPPSVATDAGWKAPPEGISVGNRGRAASFGAGATGSGTSGIFGAGLTGTLPSGWGNSAHNVAAHGSHNSALFGRPDVSGGNQQSVSSAAAATLNPSGSSLFGRRARVPNAWGMAPPSAWLGSGARALPPSTRVGEAASTASPLLGGQSRQGRQRPPRAAASSGASAPTAPQSTAGAPTADPLFHYY